MTRIAIVNAGSGLIVGTNDAGVLSEGEDNILAWAARHVAESDPQDARTFDIYRLRQSEGMADADYWAVPKDLEALKASGAEHIRTVRVPMDRNHTRQYGP